MKLSYALFLAIAALVALVAVVSAAEGDTSAAPKCPEDTQTVSECVLLEDAVVQDNSDSEDGLVTTVATTSISGDGNCATLHVAGKGLDC